MDKKMTSGEIAKKAGVSQKAVRLYDEKGLLKPTEYSEGNYRLYDQGALQVLEKIVALKQIGFSLEEIRDNITSGDAADIGSALRMQLAGMEQKRDEITQVIDTIRRTLERNPDDLDWDDVADIVQSIRLDQRADRSHLETLQHQTSKEDWYVKIFRSLHFKKDLKVLDLGCGFAKLWRNNWSEIPTGTQIFAYDIHGSWADDFAKYVDENHGSLPKGVDIHLAFEDVEKESTWRKIAKNKKYDRIIAHYLNYELKDPEALVNASAKVLSKNGFFSCNGPSVNSWNRFFITLPQALSLDMPFIAESIADQEIRRDAFTTMLMKYFSHIEIVPVRNEFLYSDADELIAKMKDLYPAQEKFFSKNQDKICAYFRHRIEEEDGIRIAFETQFSHCYL